MNERIRNYTYVLAITIIALLVAGIGGLYILGQYTNDGMLDANEVTQMVLLAIALFTQVSVLFNNRAAREIRKDLNGRMEPRFNQLREDIGDDRREDNK